MKKTYATVVGIVKFGEDILILKRNPNRHSSPSKWQPVSGFDAQKKSLVFWHVFATGVHL